VELLSFLLGLGIGLLLLWWQRLKSSEKIERLLRSFRQEEEFSSLSLTSQLSLAIARHQQTQQQLEQQIEIYRQILYQSPIGFLQVDDENRLIWFNSKACELLGITPDHAVRLPRLLLELVRSYELDHLIEETRNLDKPCQNDWTLYPVSLDPADVSHPSPYALRGYGFPLLSGHVGIFLENRQEAVTLVQQRDRWASDVAHELKTPLTSIRLVAETLYSRIDPPLQGWVERLIGEATRLSNLVQDLLDLSRIERSSFKSLQLKILDLPDLIQSAWQSLEPLARKKQLQLQYLGPEQLRLQADESRLYRVLINLLDNSIKYSPPWKSIRVKLSFEETEPDLEQYEISESQQVCIEVIDQGPGFPEEALPHVFERFYRADPARSQHLIEHKLFNLSSQEDNVAHITETQQDPGRDRPALYTADLQHRNSSGLGLAIVKQIVEAHGGEVYASNHPETGGAWLRVYLPWKQTGFAAVD
jgi:two-component system phosphate regulon sensor histidine kinase PhoR